MAEMGVSSKNTIVKDDRLSSLPDELLINILSRLSINSAATTSVLSHRWRHLWTAVTRFEFHYDNHSLDDDERFPALISDILGKLTSPILTMFHLHSRQDVFGCCVPEVAKSCFQSVCSRNVEQIIIDSKEYYDNDELFYVPACLLQAAQSLVILELGGSLWFEFLENKKIASLHFPKLKKLRLRFLVNVRPWLGGLIRACPLLEHLDLMFHLFIETPSVYQIKDPCLKIFAPNLKSLKIVMHSSGGPRTKIFVDAPKLVNIVIHDCISCYYFVRYPTRLAKAYINLTEDPDYTECEVDKDDGHIAQMAKFVARLSSVSSLALHVEHRSNVYRALDSVYRELKLPAFRKVACLTTCLDGIGVIGWKYLVRSLQYFPNLKQLAVKCVNIKGYKCREEVMACCAPDTVPYCLTNKLKTIKISGLNIMFEDFQLLDYILRNATVLKELKVYDAYKFGSREDQLWNACKFCKWLFEVPRGSTACEIIYKDSDIQASSSDFNGRLTCQIFNLG